MLPSRAGHVRAAVLQLPSHLRLRAYQQCSSRAFSASASRKVEATEAVDQALDLANVVAIPSLAVLDSLHAIGLPWYAVIPTTAILVRGVFGFYFASAPARRRQQINSNLHPLVAARLDQIAYTREQFTKERMLPIERLRLQIANTHKYGRQFGAGLIAFSSFLNFGLMIATAEAVRMKCGARDGLLSTIMTPFNWLHKQLTQEHWVSPVSGVPDAAESRAQKLAEKLERVRELRLQQAQEQSLSAEIANSATSAEPFLSVDLLSGAASLPPPPPPPVVNVHPSWFDPALQTEGFSWCTDLTMADPTHILPVLTAGAMLATVVLNPLTTPRWVPRAQGMPAPIKFIMTRYTMTQGVFAVITVAIGYSLQHVPAAVSLYLFSSFVAGFISKRWMDVTMPLRKPIKPCARRTRQRSKKEWGARG